MKRIYKIAVVLLFITQIISPALTIGQSKSNLLKFSGKVKDIGSKEHYNKLIIRYNSDDQFMPTGQHDLEAKIDTTGNFSFQLPNLNKPYKLILIIYSCIERGKGLWSNISYTQPGDNIHMKIVLGSGVSDSVQVSGKGSEKYNLAYRLNKLYGNSYYKDPLFINDGPIKNTNELSSKMAQLTDLIRKYKIMTALRSTNVSINSQMKDILNNEYNPYNNEWIFRMRLMYKKVLKDQVLRQVLISYYRLHAAEFSPQPNKESWMCYFGLFSITEKMEMDQMMEKDTISSNLVELYTNIKTMYCGKLREKLISNVIFYNLLRRHNGVSTTILLRDSLINDASKLVSLPYLKKAFSEKIMELEKVNNKSKVIDSEFTLLNGEKLKLSALKGKIYLIDAWFNGCWGCADFHKIFEKEIYPKFKDNNNFAVLSINIDINKQRWIDGIKGKLYTDSSYINVSTANGLDHPFMKYYSVIGAPYLMLVDADGSIIYQPKMASVKDMNEEIEKALAKIKNKVQEPDSSK